MKFSIKRTLSLLLVLVMLVGLLPVVALADEGDSGDVPAYGSVDVITGNASVSGSGSASAVVTCQSATLQWAPADATIGRPQDGWWIGIKVTAPVSMTEDACKEAKYQRCDSGNWTDAKSFWTFKDSSAAPHYITMWGYVDSARLTAAVSSNTNIEYKWQFDWNNDSTYEQLITLSIVPDEIILKKGDEVVHCNHKLTGIEAVEATCTAGGHGAYWICELCGQMYADAAGEAKITEIPSITQAKGHQLESKTAQASTCIEHGWAEHYVCTVCGATFSDKDGKTDFDPALPLAEHVYSDKWTIDKAATCTEKGSMSRHCTQKGCTEKTEVKEIAATGHTSSSWIVGQYPTEKRNGYMYKKCTVCGTHLDYMVLTWRDVKPTLPFVDVDSRDSYFDAVCYVYDKGLMKGTSDTRFSPSRSFDRAMVAMILYRMEGRPSVKFNSVFPDVGKNDWYADCISWAYKNGVLKGYDDGTARPEDPVTVEQLLTILYRYADSEGYRVTGRGSVDRYYDADDISAYALKAVRWAVSEGLISGRGYLGPKSNASRAEVAEILTNFCKNVLNYK